MNVEDFKAVFHSHLKTKISFAIDPATILLIVSIAVEVLKILADIYFNRAKILKRNLSSPGPITSFLLRRVIKKQLRNISIDNKEAIEDIMFNCFVDSAKSLTVEDFSGIIENLDGGKKK